MILDKIKIRVLIVVGFLLLTTYFASRYIKNDINSNAEYTIGFVYDYMEGITSGEYIYYRYYVSGQVYENINSYDKAHNVKIGDYYMVKYSTSNPEHSELQQGLLITDTIQIKAAGFKLLNR
ncbi:hypothetical protein [Zobellia galactanivorans]|uniref:hypothetical protein n=1 Tax=Zobellia galactanivorans (strain DSM 12802 / CCUG 47099 / CIP 106680 / NCIMB 13871 / Dsij) TaxID=63186 RepID=UPI001C066D71|nr:hypothetical protein [Zobellia galactanivorans]MBU3025978.1 hypothetical protein [Zobellia galactanivorans]